MTGPELAVCVRRAGKRGRFVEAILSVAQRELEVTMIVVKVRPELIDEVRSRVLKQVWTSWIPEAKRRLATGDWPRDRMVSKLRTALSYYAGCKVKQAAAREKSWEARATGHGMRAPAATESPDIDAPEPPDIDAPRKEWIERGMEERFLGMLVKRANGELEELDEEQARTLLRLVAITRRATKGIRANEWTWLALLREFREAMEA